MVALSYISYALEVFYCTQKYLSWIKKTISLSYPESPLVQTCNAAVFSAVLVQVQ